jgi:YVTN family beta-propeller protein
VSSVAVAAAAQAQPRAYVTSQTSDDRVWVIETVTNTVVDTVTVADVPSRVAITPDGSFAYVTIVVNEEFLLHSGASVFSSMPPSPILMAPALSKSTSVLSSSSVSSKSASSDSFFSNKVEVIDTSTNAIVATVTTEEHAPFGIAITPDGRAAYVTHLNGSVSAIDTVSNSVVATIPVGGEALDVAITPDGSFAYVTISSSGSVSVIDTATHAVVATVEVGDTPSGIAITPDGASAYVTNMRSNTVSQISIPLNMVVETLSVGDAPGGIAITPDGASAYVTNQLSNDVSVINAETNTVDATVAVGNTPIDVAITPNGRLAYITNISSHEVSVIDTTTNILIDVVEVGFLPEGIAMTPEQPATIVAIDIRPGAAQNRINPRAEGGIWVAVLSDDEFDPLQLDVGTIRFGPAEARATVYAVRDVDGDGVADLLLRFRIQETGIRCGDPRATLSGQTYLQQQIAGTDSIETVGCSRATPRPTGGVRSIGRSMLH